MTSLPKNIYSHCQTVLTKCSVFESQSSLKSVFVITELAPFKDALPESQNKQERVNQTISFLISHPVSKARNNLLLLFLEALTLRYNEGDQLREELSDLRRRIANWLNEYSVIEIPIISLAMTRDEAEMLINGAIFFNTDVPPVAGNKFKILCDLLKEHGVTDLLTLYGEKREDWKVEYQSPNGSVFATVEKVVTDAMNYINEKCHAPKRLAPLRPRFESAAFFDPSTRTETWHQLQECGCVVVADAVSLFHPKLSRAFLQSALASNDRVAIFIHSPINFRSMRINSFLEEQVNSEIEYAFQRFDKRFDKLCELGIGGVLALRRWLNAIVPDIEEVVRRERPRESNCEFMRELAPKNDVGRFIIPR